MCISCAHYRHWQYELDRRQRGKAPRLWVAVVKLFWVKLLAQFILYTFQVCSKRHLLFSQYVHTFSIATGYGSFSYRELFWGLVNYGRSRMFISGPSDQMFIPRRMVYPILTLISKEVIWVKELS